MRKIDWEKPLSDEDIAWLRQSGMFNIEERIQRHQESFGKDVESEDVQSDPATRSALDPLARVADLVDSHGGPINTTPEPGSVQAGDAVLESEDESDDYANWKVSELTSEIDARNDLATKRDDVTEVKIEATGKDDKVLKADLVKGLRLWDQENPDALND